MSQFERLQTWIEVVEKGSFAEAARTLGVSKAAVSKQVASLEAEWGLQLLTRTTRRLKLTESGEQLYEQAKRLLQEFNELTWMRVGMVKEPQGQLSVVSGTYFAHRYILRHLPEFCEKFPKLTLKLELAERIPDLDKEHIDLIIGMSISGPPQTIQRRILSTHYVICASPLYLEKYGIPLIPSDLRRHRYITHTMRKPNDIIPFPNDLEVVLTPILYLNDVQAMLECAMAGMGLIRVHNYVVKEALAKRQLVAVLQHYQREEIPIYVSYRESRFIPSKIRQFIDFILPKLSYE
jgi:DNA-binding transcriptional LysR family regulator